MALESQLRNQNYKRWIRGCLGFKYLREGLVNTVDTIVKDQHKALLQACKRSSCDKCCIDKLLPSHVKAGNVCPKGRRRCFCIMHSKNGMQCPNSFCGHVYDAIVNNYLFSDPNWSNTDITEWGRSYVEIAKCYIGSSGYKDKLTIMDIDCSGLLSIAINNVALRDLVMKTSTSQDVSTYFSQARDDRNDLFHSPSLELSDDKLKSIADNIVNLLQLPKIIDTDGKVKQSIENVQKIRDGNIFLSLKDEQEAQKEAIEAIMFEKEKALADINKSKQEVIDRLTCLKEDFDAKVIEISNERKVHDADIEKVRDELKTRYEVISNTCKELDERQNETAVSLTNLHTYVKSLDTRFCEQSAKHTDIENQISEIRQTIDTYLIVKLEQENEKLLSDTASEKLTKCYHFTQKKEELQTKLCDYYKKCFSTIQVSPVLQKISGTVDEVFVEFSISTNLKGKEDPVELNQENMYKQILFKDETLCKNVYLHGEAGMGKTTWCKKFLYTWVKACTNVLSCGRIESTAVNKAIGNKEAHFVPINDDVCCLKQFHILFYIALRKESRHVRITDMIKRHPVVTEYSLQTVVEDILRYEPESCIIILDGLDEWEPYEDVNIPSREGLHGCTVVTTSRKYRLVDMDMASESCPDRLVGISGIRNKELLIKNVIRQLNGVMTKGHKENDYASSEEYCTQFIREAKEMKDRDISFQHRLPSYMDIPLLLIISICVWFDNGKIEDTLYKNMSRIIEFMISYAEGFQQGVYKKKNEYTGKLGSMTNLNRLKREWSSQVETLPFQVRSNNVLVPYSGLISKLARFAFETLFNAEHKRRLTFSQTELHQFFFSVDELRVIMKIGFLSQSEVTESSLCPVTSLSFMHNTFHLYFAGLHLARLLQFPPTANEYIRTIKTLADYFKDPDGTHLLDIDDTILFAGNIDRVAGSKLSEALFKDLPLVEYEKHSDYFNKFFLRNVQDVHVHDEKYPSQDFPVYTERVSVPNNLQKEKLKYLNILLKTNAKHIRFVEVPGEIAAEVLESFRDQILPQEFKLRIYDIVPYSQGTHVIKSLECIQELQRLELRSISIDSSEPADQCVSFDLTNTRLTKLELKGFSNITILVRNCTEVLCDDKTNYKIKVQSVD